MFHSWKKPQKKKVRWAVSLFKSNSWWHLSGTSFTVYDLWQQGLHCLVRPMLVHSWDPQDASCEVHADHAGFAYWLSDLSDVPSYFFRGSNLQEPPGAECVCQMMPALYTACHCTPKAFDTGQMNIDYFEDTSSNKLQCDSIPEESGSQHVAMGQYLLVSIFRYF